jgi:acetyltransferase-like isoleucine patch superfamily enzyme
MRIAALRAGMHRLLGRLPPRLQARLAAWRSRGRATLGPGAYLHRSVQVLGLQQLSVGENSVVSQDTWFNVNHREQPVPAIRIGRHCFIGRRNFFSSGRLIVIGDYVLTANDCHFLGSSHLLADPFVPCISTGTTDSDVITVGHNTFFGAGARVLGHVTIGHGCMIGANALVTRDVPPFSQVAGFPATVRKRFSVPRNAWVGVDEFTAADEAALPDADSYLAGLKRHPAPRMPYLAAGGDMGQV